MGGRRPGGRLRAVASGLLAFVAAVAFASCVGRDDEPPPTYTARDSAGVEIVESRVCAWGASAPWTVSDTAELTIGELGGQSVYTFARVTDALRYPDGRIAVADDGSGEVRVFGADGRHVRSFGRRGDGPGEFMSIRRIMLGQERLWVFDGESARVSAFDESGVLTETRPVVGDGSVVQAIADVRLMRNGELFGVDADSLVTGTAPSLLRDTAHVFLLGGAPRSVLIVPGAWTQIQVIDGQSSSHRQPLTPVPSWDVAGSNLYFSSGERFEFAVADTAGRIRRIVRRQDPPPPATDADVARFRAAVLDELSPAERAVAEQAFAAATIPQTLPVYDDLLVDPSGDVWARRFGTETPDWDLYDSRGSCRGSVRMPTGLKVLEIGEDYVLGVSNDPEGGQTVRLHRVVTEQPAPTSAS